MTGVIKLIIATRNGQRGTAFQSHLLEILEESPDWTPGKYTGEAIPVRMIMHIYVNSGANTGTKEVKINNLSSTAFKKKKNDYYYNNAESLSEEGNFSESIENFTLALQYNPGDIAALYKRGIVKYKTKDETGACEDWNKIKSLGKSDADELLNKYCESKEDEHKK
jgi:tetratricopeptide (TPR) repeat protein